MIYAGLGPRVSGSKSNAVWSRVKRPEEGAEDEEEGGPGPGEWEGMVESEEESERRKTRPRYLRSSPRRGTRTPRGMLPPPPGSRWSRRPPLFRVPKTPNPRFALWQRPPRVGPGIAGPRRARERRGGEGGGRGREGKKKKRWIWGGRGGQEEEGKAGSAIETG